MRVLLLIVPFLALPALADVAVGPWHIAQIAPTTDSDSAPGASPARRTTTRAFQPVFKLGVDDVLIETGTFPNAPEADSGTTLRVSPYLSWQPQREWEFRAGLRLDGVNQRGGSSAYNQWRADYAETYLRYRTADTRLTVGAQTIVWGRVDAIPLIDRVSRADLTRFVLDDLPERRRAQLALRWEQTLDDYKADAVLLPTFRGARLPDLKSVWSPINRLSGEVIGIAPNPALSALARAAPVGEDDSGAGGGALRLTRTGVAPLDFGITLARARQSLPYYRVDVTKPSLTAIHPFNTFVGADVEFVTGDFTWRSEIGLTDGQPVTLPSAQMSSTRVLDWIGAVEFFPGGKNTRVNLQLVAHKLRTGQAVLELKEYYGINGEVETTLDQGRWKLGVRFFSGLNVHDTYLAPKLSYLGWEPHELYLTARYFDGESRTLGGFHRDHRMIAIGVKTRF